MLEEARQEICCLERKNNVMEDALSDLHKWLAGVNNLTSTDGNELIAPTGANISAGKMSINIFCVVPDHWFDFFCIAGMQTSIQAGDPDVTALNSENESLRRQLDALKEITESLTSKVVSFFNWCI